MRDGPLPLDTGGRWPSVGRLLGFGLTHEAVVQFRGEGGGERRVAEPEAAAVSTGGGLPGGYALLTVDR